MDRGVGVTRVRGGGEGGGSELGSDLDLDPWKIFWIRIRQDDADPLDPDPQHWPRWVRIIEKN